MRPTVMSAATLNFFNFGFQALFILYVTTYLNVSVGLAWPGARSRRDWWSAGRNRGSGHRPAAGPWPSLRLRSRPVPGGA